MAMTLEALISALAVAYRIRLLSRERDDARIQEAAARLLADTDPLTGLLNRRAFLREAIGRTGDQTLLIADIDHFKRVNDTLGHDGGDEVLRLFARALKAAAPAEALVARIGGEEFAIVAAIEAGLEPEPILARLRAERMPFDLTVTASIGTCSGPLETEAQWKLLYRFADRALFDAKAEGRDRARTALAVAYAA
jgi:diguanylate cyclase (GGDEF)-like protein